MDIKLISFAACPYVHRSTIMLHEKGVPFEIQYIDLANKPAWFLELSPRGKVPVMITGGVTIFESAVINEFLDETHPPRLLPDDPFQRAVHRAWVEVANDLFLAHYKLAYAAANKEEYETARKSGVDVLRRFETMVKGHFFAGETFGLVDAAVAPALHRFNLLEPHIGSLFDEVPKVRAWAQAIAARPSVVKGVLPEFRNTYIEGLRNRAGYVSTLLAAA